MVPNEGEQGVITLAKELRAGGLSLRSIARELAVAGYLSRSGCPFLATQILRMLQSKTISHK
jgi:hypothetical protein